MILWITLFADLSVLLLSRDSCCKNQQTPHDPYRGGGYIENGWIERQRSACATTTCSSATKMLELKRTLFCFSVLFNLFSSTVWIAEPTCSKSDRTQSLSVRLLSETQCNGTRQDLTGEGETPECKSFNRKTQKHKPNRDASLLMHTRTHIWAHILKNCAGPQLDNTHSWRHKSLKNK